MARFLVGSENAGFVARGYTINHNQPVVVIRDTEKANFAVLVGTYPNQEMSTFEQDFEACMFAGELCGV